jgi:hypothetical protein
MIAPPRPCSADQHLLRLRRPANQRREREHEQPGDERPALAEQVGGAPAEHQKAGERDRVGVDDPLQVGVGEAEALVDRRQRDVDDRDVEDDHELRQAAEGQQQRVARRPVLLLGGDLRRV